jgi:CII-binding regulator of phage lambda lysogenization HflD
LFRQIFTNLGNIAVPDTITSVSLANPVTTLVLRVIPELWDGVPFMMMSIQHCGDSVATQQRPVLPLQLVHNSIKKNLEDQMKKKLHDKIGQLQEQVQQLKLKMAAKPKLPEKVQTIEHGEQTQKPRSSENHTTQRRKKYAKKNNYRQNSRKNEHHQAAQKYGGKHPNVKKHGGKDQTVQNHGGKHQKKDSVIQINAKHTDQPTKTGRNTHDKDSIEEIHNRSDDLEDLEERQSRDQNNAKHKSTHERRLSRNYTRKGRTSADRKSNSKQHESQSSGRDSKKTNKKETQQRNKTKKFKEKPKIKSAKEIPKSSRKGKGKTHHPQKEKEGKGPGQKTHHPQKEKEGKSPGQKTHHPQKEKEGKRPSQTTHNSQKESESIVQMSKKLDKTVKKLNQLKKQINEIEKQKPDVSEPYTPDVPGNKSLFKTKIENFSSAENRTDLSLVAMKELEKEITDHSESVCKLLIVSVVVFYS